MEQLYVVAMVKVIDLNGTTEYAKWLQEHATTCAILRIFATTRTPERGLTVSWSDNAEMKYTVHYRETA